MLTAFIILYLYAGIFIANFAKEYLDEHSPNYFRNKHKSLNAPWDLNVSKGIFVGTLTLLWVLIPCAWFVDKLQNN
jgi:hypothetical protein